ncbi:MAG: AraC family transcriptional regulator [Clostridiales bacterium]|nr:AraC family transcriptional regulator [Clostridiales bacterium]
MRNEIWIDGYVPAVIKPLFFGSEVCKKGHEFGPYARSHYIVHFCVSGKGKLFDKFGEQDVTAGQMFIIRPNEITTYTADKVHPWEYCWIAFECNNFDLFDTDKSVYYYPKEIADELMDLVTKKISDSAIYTALVYKIIYSVSTKVVETECAVDKIIRYIDFNFMADISMAFLSKTFGYERSYLYRIFKARTNKSVKEYVTDKRMKQAKVLLGRGESVTGTAYAVGYKDEFNFSKAFKKRFGFSPNKLSKPQKN